MECCDVAKCAECWRESFEINLKVPELARCGDCHKIATEGAIRQVESPQGSFAQLIRILR